MKSLKQLALALALFSGLSALAEESGSITVKGISGLESTQYATFADAYAAIKPKIEALAGTSDGEATADAFDALFTDVDADGKATLTYTISGAVTYSESGYANLLSMGRQASYFGNNRHLINFKFVGATGCDTDTLTINSTITLPTEKCGEKTVTGLHFENLTLTGSATRINPQQANFERINLSVANCALKGFGVYSGVTVGGSCSVTDSVIDGTGTSLDYPIQISGSETEALAITIKGNTISGFKRGINIEQKTAVLNIEDNTISVTDSGRSCIQLTMLAKATITGNTLNLTGGNAFTLHENLVKLTTPAVVTISGNTITGTGYLIYDDAKAEYDDHIENPEGRSIITSAMLKLTYTKDNVVADTVDTTQGIKGGTKRYMSPVVNYSVAHCVAVVDETGYETVDAAMEAAAAKGEAATVELLVDTEDATIVPTWFLKNDVTITAASATTATFVPVENATDAPDTDGMLYLASDDTSSVRTFTVGGNVTLAVPKSAKMNGALYFGYGKGGNWAPINVVVNGRIEAYEPYLGSGSMLTISKTGSFKSIEECLITRKGSTMTVTGTDGSWSAANPQVILTYARQQGGAVSFKDTFVKVNTNWEMWNRNSETESATKLTLDNTTLVTDDLKGTSSDGTTSAYEVELKNGSQMTLAGDFGVIAEGVVTIEAGSQIAAKSISNKGTINIDATDSDLVKVIDYTGTDTLTLESYGTVNVTGGKACVKNNDLWVSGTVVAKIKDAEYYFLADAIDAAEEGDTITLVADITDPDAADANIEYDLTGVTLDLNDHTYSQYNFAHVFWGTGGVIKNGTMVCLNGGSYALCIGVCHTGRTDYSDGFTVENVKMTGGINAFYSNIVLKDLEVKAQNYYAVWLDVLAFATIEGGSYEAIAKDTNKALLNGTVVNVGSDEEPEMVPSEFTVVDGTLKTLGNPLMGSSGGSLAVYGGTFDTAVDAAYCAAGYSPAENEDGSYGVVISDPRLLGYADESGELAALPEAPTVSNDVWNVTAANAQYVLDGAYGSIDGKTINFTENITDTLILGRATKYEGSGTTYHFGSFDSEAVDYSDLVKATGKLRYYDRVVENVTFTADKGVTLKGFTAEGGNHVYGTTASPVYDCVRDVSTKDTNNSYYKRTTLKNFTFKGLTLTARTDISTSNAATVYDGFTFTGCTFNIGNGTTSDSTYQALRYYDENNSGNVKNLVVENCTFNKCYQGVFTTYVNGITVKNCTFATMYHNAIAVQSGAHGACNFGAVVITGNTFSGLKDRAIRIGTVGADTQFTIKYNVVKSTTSTEECMKASGGEDLAESVSCDVNYNDWGTYLLAVPAQLRDKTMVAKIGETEYSTLSAALAAAESGDTVTLISDITLEPKDSGVSGGYPQHTISGKTLTLDFNGHTIAYSEASGANELVCVPYTIQLESGANVTVTGNGVLDTELGMNSAYGFSVVGNSSLTIESGTFTGAPTAVQVSQGSLTVNGGTFKLAKTILTVAPAQAKYVVNCIDRYAKDGSAKIALKGGSYCYDYSQDTEGAGKPYLVAGKTSLAASDGQYIIAPETSQLVTVKPEETSTETVEIALTEAVLDKVTGDTTTAKAEELNKTAANGIPVWVNIVAGIDAEKQVGVDAAQNSDTSTIDVTLPDVTGALVTDASGDKVKVETGIDIAYSVDEVSAAGTVETAGSVVAAPAINIDSVETSAYFRVNVVLRQNGATLATVPATNFVGVLKKSTKAKKTIVPVPWNSLTDGGDISVSNIVKTANLTAGDKMHVYNATEKRYDVYTLKTDKTWEPAAVYSVGADGQVSSTSSGTPESTKVARGSGVWLERTDTSAPIVTYGQAPEATEETSLASGTEESPTWSLVAVPKTESVDLSTVAAPTAAAADTVIVPTEGAPRVYTVKNGVWGYDETVKVTDSEGNDTGIVRIERKTDTTLEPGTGFWYLNSGSEKKVNW